MSLKKETGRGSITITNEVMGKIILEEVAKYHNRVVISDRNGKVLSRWQQLGGIDETDKMEFKLDENGLHIRVFVMLLFGTSISRVSAALTESINERFEDYLGIKPAEVRVIVRGMMTHNRSDKKLFDFNS